MKFGLGRAHIKVEGVNLVRLLNNLKAQGIVISKIIRQESNCVEMQIPYEYLPHLIAKCRELCYTTTILSIPWYVRLYRCIFSHIGMVSGVFVASIVIAICGQLCLGISVQCSDKELEDSIQQYLSADAVLWHAKSNIDCVSIEQELLDEFEEISLLDISFRGVYMIVNTTLATPPIDTEVDEGGAILAKADGVVTRIHLVSGTAEVKVGDVVTEGQVLISNYYIDRLGERVECEAEGTVYATKWYSATVDFAINTIEYTRTGECLVETSLSFLGKEIPLGVPVDLPQHYDVEVVKESFGETALPVYLIFTQYYPTTAVEVTRDFESQREALIYEAKELALSQCDESMVVDQKHTISLVGGVYFVTYYLSVDRQIS